MARNQSRHAASPAAPESISKTQRWLDLVALLLGRTLPVTVDEIMERVPAYANHWREGDDTTRESVRRAFERDKDELRAAGVPIETVRFAINYGAEELDGYRIARSDFYLPYLRILAGPDDPAPAPSSRRMRGIPHLDLTPAEAERAIDALRRVAELPAFPFADDARSALRKLSFDIDSDQFPADPVVWVGRPGAREVLERLRVLSDALLTRKRVRFVYHGIHRGEPTQREVAPYGLFFQRDWYLVGYATERDAIRVFRVARMGPVVLNASAPKRPDFAIPPDFHLQAYLDRSAWELGEPEAAVEAAVRFHSPPAAEVRTFRVSRPNPFLRWILSLGGDAEIVSPPELRDALQSMARETAALYAADDREMEKDG